MTADKQQHQKKDVFGWRKNIVKDPNAPMLYSQQAIWAFSTFFTVIFGAILLALNIKGKGRWIVLSFGLVYTLIAIVILNNIRPHAGIVLAINAGGGYLLTQLFWIDYVGVDTKYRIKPIWVPLVISLFIIAVFILVMIYAEPSHRNY